ncbi:hypothetical protein [Roseibium sp.]|uniref:hypothetical protein n=1 Tax=Roseibium sp. TaxID=1936156 RepID=UPI003D121170
MSKLRLTSLLANLPSRLLFALVCLMVPQNIPFAHAGDGITLYLNLLPHRLTRNSGKQYDLFLQELLQDSGLKVDLRPGPMGRSKTDFLHDPGSCLFPTNLRALNVGELGNQLESSVRVDVVSLRLYTAKEKTAGAKLSDFDPARVGYIRGSGAIYALGGDRDRFVPIDTEAQLIQMLELDRIDAFLGHHPDTALAIHQLGKPDALHVSPLNFENLRFPVSFVCHKTAVNRHFLETINPSIEQMHADGRMRTIFGPHAEFNLSDEPQDDGPLVR